MARTILRKLTRNFLLIPTFILCVLFLVGSLSPLLNPAHWWWIGFLSLLQPYLICLLILLFIFWLAAKPVIALVPLVCLLIGWKQVHAIFAINPIVASKLEKGDTSIRVVSWNVGNMSGLGKVPNSWIHTRSAIANIILNLEPDIICLQEFNHSVTQGKQADNIGLFSDMYPFHYFSKDVNKRNGFYQAGSIIFSKFPILDSGKIAYPKPIKESFIYADVKKGKDTFRIYNVHLQSFKLNDSDYGNIEKITNEEDVSIPHSVSLFHKMKRAFTRRGTQADVVHQKIEDCPYKSLVCGDFNDVPGSYVYFRIREKRKDAFLEKGFGVGRTFVSLAPTLRIDYILPDRNFDVQQFDMIDEGLSDHILLVSDMSIKK